MAVPQWTQNSGYKLGTLQERVTTSITLPIAPGSASGTGFDPAQTSVSLPAQGRIQNSTTITITKNVSDHIIKVKEEDKMDPSIFGLYS